MYKYCATNKGISIHALREESDSISVLLPHWRGVISIHALREESDRISSSHVNHVRHFNPRSP